MADETRECPACGRAVDVELFNCPACGGRWSADGSFTPFELPRLDTVDGRAGVAEGPRPATGPAPRRPTDVERRRRRFFLIVGIAVVDLLIAVALIIVYLSGALG
jgi:endogenous inhibitor of DNA gyrase (YacG/DUF329 family)